ncbi:MAG TPA: IS21 family transposase [Acidimicrobiales bacterium]
MITLENWALIRHLHLSEGESMRSIAERLEISRNTVAKAVTSTSPPHYERTAAPNSVSPFEPQIRSLLAEYPKMPATVIAERIGWTGSSSFFRKRIAEIRPDYAPVDPADRISYEPGDQMQCDLWFPPAKIPLGAGQFGSPPVLVMVPSHSRFICARMIHSRTTEDLCLGMWWLLQSFGAVPRRLVWDNEAGIGRRNKLTDQVTSFAGTLGTKFVQLKPYDPESKGVVERMNGFFETSFMPGRDFSSPEDFNEQLAAWLPLANNRLVRRTGQRPNEAVEEDRKSMFALPPVAPVLGVLGRVRLARDYYLRVASNDYSAHPSAIGSFVDVAYDLETVRFSALGRDVGTHRRSWARAETFSDPLHVEAARELRALFQAPRPTAPDDWHRNLADYDEFFQVAL